MGRNWSFFWKKVIQEGDYYKGGRVLAVEWPEKALDPSEIHEVGKG